MKHSRDIRRIKKHKNKPFFAHCRKFLSYIVLGLVVFGTFVSCVPKTEEQPLSKATYPNHTSTPDTVLAKNEAIDNNDEVVVLKYGHSQTTDHPFHLSALYLAETVKNRTNGRVLIDVYSDSSLGDEISLLKGIAAGNVDMGSISTGNMSAVVKDFSVFEIPYLFSDYQHVDAALRDGAAGDYMEAAALGQGITILSWSESGFRHFLNAKKDIYLPLDLGGMRVRTPEWGIFVDVCNSFGAKVIATPFNEVYTASQSGIIDAQEGPLMAFVTGRMYMAMKYLTLDSHIYAGDCKVIASSSLEKLSKEDADILIEATYEAGEYQRTLIRASESEYLQMLKEYGVKIVEEVDKYAWQEACSFVYDKYDDQLNMDLVQLIKNANPL